MYCHQKKDDRMGNGPYALPVFFPLLAYRACCQNYFPRIDDRVSRMADCRSGDK